MSALGDPYPLRDFVERGEDNSRGALERRRAAYLARKRAADGKGAKL